MKLNIARQQKNPQREILQNQVKIDGIIELKFGTCRAYDF